MWGYVIAAFGGMVIGVAIGFIIAALITAND